jgi:DnaJ like chaperone protein
MGWYGKLIGGAIGFTFLGGPFGGILGVAIGHSFDKRAGQGGSSSDYSQSSRTSAGGSFTSTDQAQMTFFVATFSMLGKLAKADGHVSREELTTIDNFMTRTLKLGIQEKQFATRIVNTAANSSESFEKFADQFYSAFKTQPQLLNTMMDILLQVSIADKVLSPEEEKLINQAASTFNISSTALDNMKSRYFSSTEKYYSTIGCRRSDSVDTIKKNYKKLVKDYHPDSIASKGLPEEFTKFASEKFRELNSAYEKIREERNF